MSPPVHTDIANVKAYVFYSFTTSSPRQPHPALSQPCLLSVPLPVARVLTEV